jgi:hypothetical protein
VDLQYAGLDKRDKPFPRRPCIIQHQKTKEVLLLIVDVVDYTVIYVFVHSS